ncbi:ribosomal protein L18 [Candidatus Carsonella ruddii CS isolate Thao2000]|uniref:Ribosomal protein L18 n=1 Tax=Candidatus Carsonella ruddii CS isolate Thao2000 TaxID=1202537 RepID=J7H0H7_CARRU|nr:hypothetical protein [Candidatus Carsonella ruddii]AFP83815.1 ribosomal protein L18 [Candidatus Carsonella ruddii CS isolate Thao2000]
MKIKIFKKKIYIIIIFTYNKKIIFFIKEKNFNILKKKIKKILFFYNKKKFIEKCSYKGKIKFLINYINGK